MQKIDQLSIDTLRLLCIDSVENANHGHLGMPLGSAPMAYTLWKYNMKHNPKNPNWFNRDRFILTSGHGSILLYSLLHVFGYDLTIEDLKAFRTLDSRTPGHPEVGVTPGVEATTGPLGQGFAMTVGFAIAEKHLAEKYNREGFPIIDHYTYTICGDGDLMEGVASEAASLAGHLGLGKLIVLYDSNDVCSDGDVDYTFTENTLKKFEALGWNTILVDDGNDIDKIQEAIVLAKQQKEKPTLIEVKNIIGYGSPNLQGTSKIHSNPVGEEEVKLIKAEYGWKYDEKFFVPSEVKEHVSSATTEGAKSEEEWNKLFEQYKAEYPELAKELVNIISNKVEIPIENMPVYPDGKVATRTASGKALNNIYKIYPKLFGGSADLASSNKTTIEESTFVSRDDFKGANLHFGVREFAMACICNGVTLHGGVRGYCGTFLVFSDYMRSAIRLSALMGTPVIYIFTHDSVAVGQDGPTHQPIEHLASLRAMPNIKVIRPADGNETIYAWKLAVENLDSPTALILGRQDVPILEGVNYEGVKRGAYIISKSKKPAEGILIATGSEVHVAIEAQEKLEAEGIHVNVVSMPSWELFENQTREYKDSVLDPNIKKRLAVEAGSSLGWERYVGTEGKTISIDHFGKSGNGAQLIKELGFNSENIVKVYKSFNN